jgi:hypothetical protein
MSYRFSAGIVYNNFPWPQAETAKQRQPSRKPRKPFWMSA